MRKKTIEEKHTLFPKKPWIKETPIRNPKDMGIVWEAYHKGVPLLGVPGITLEWDPQQHFYNRNQRR